MFRASDIFGRKPGTELHRPAVQVKVEAGAGGGQHPGSSTGSSGPSNRVWDPATGRWLEEPVPADIQAMMGGPSKRMKVEFGYEAYRQPAKVLGPAAIGLVAGGGQHGAAQQGGLGYGGAFRSSPSIEFKGFSKAELDDRFFERPEVAIHGRPTYWNNDGTFFVYWQGEKVARWSICDATSLQVVQAGQLPGWAYKEESQGFCQAAGWSEHWDGQWRNPSVEVTSRSATHHRPNWEDVPGASSEGAGAAASLPTAAAAVGAQADEDHYAHLEHAQVPQLRASEYAILVQKIYERKNPGKLQDMGRLLQRYKGQERDLYLEVCKKYGEHPAKFQARHCDEVASEERGAHAYATPA